MAVVTEAQAWPSELQRASICSSGYGGANAHAILESFSSYTNKAAKTVVQSLATGQCFVLPVSAGSIKSLERRADEISRIARSCGISDIERLSYTLGERTSHLGRRASIIVNTNKTKLAQDWELEYVEASHPGETETSDFAFVFTGQGAQYHGMGKGLLERSPIFLSKIRELDEVIRSLPLLYRPDWSLEDTLREPSDSGRIHEVTRSQPVCSAIQIALVDVLRSWGVTPSITIGHSSGEIAAAYASGLLR